LRMQLKWPALQTLLSVISNIYFFFSFQYFSKAPHWILNYNYWTAGMKNSCNSSFSWCLSATADTITQTSSSLAWDTNQPDNLGGNEACLHLKILKTGGLKLTDKNCANKFIVACKVFRLFLIKYNK
jgi:hypothetical protein